MKRLAVGVIAHVDAGKTTLTEGLLYLSGDIRRLGRVDHGDTFLDTYALEKSRGITIFSKQAVLHTPDCEITLIDTPGHADFSAETERAVGIMDYAIMIISASEGVQAHTETLWSLLESYHVPVFVFVNKTDLPDFSKERVINELCARLSSSCVDFSGINGDTDSEAVALCDDSLMQEFLENETIPASSVRKAIGKRKIFPVLFGSALRMEGVKEFLDALLFFSEAKALQNDDFSAKVYKITEDEHNNRLTHLKITGGVLKVRDMINGEKVNAIRILSGTGEKTVSKADAGIVCAVTGLAKTYAGQGLGAADDLPIPLIEPLMSYKAVLPENIDSFTVLGYLKRLEQEDPQLRIVWNEQLGEIHVQIMGDIQTEVLKSVIKERFGLDIGFENGSIAYKETIVSAVEGIGHYEPLKHYAEVRLLLEPASRGSGLSFKDNCSDETLGSNYRSLIMSVLQEKRHIGVLTGSPITDMRISLISARSHQKHTEGGDFREAVCRAVRQGLMSAKSILLEPWLSFRLYLPLSCLGRAMTDIQLMNGECEPYEMTSNEDILIKGCAPASKLCDYQAEVAAYSSGRGRLHTSPAGYRECPDTDKIVNETGYDPQSDLFEPVDSVFCSHGAGHVVRWHDVPKYAHTQGLHKTSDNNEAKFVNINDFKRQAATDKELMEIFERTYGKIDRDERAKVRRVPETPKKTPKLPQLPTGPEYLLVDGYNVIFAWDELKKLAAISLDLARSELINILCNYQGFIKNEVILVFDAYKVKGNRETERPGGITVIYTKEAETADMYIEKATRTIGKKHRVRVVTSDGTEQLIILGAGALRVSASEFRAETADVFRRIRELIGE